MSVNTTYVATYQPTLVILPAEGSVETPRRETFSVGRVPSDAKRNEKPDNSLSAFFPDLRSRSEADLQGLSTLPEAGIQRLSSSQNMWDSLFAQNDSVSALVLVISRKRGIRSLRFFRIIETAFRHAE